VWSPDATFRALDAKELAAAWLAVPEGDKRLAIRDRCIHLLNLCLGCMPPALMNDAAPELHRAGLRPLLVATDALFPLVEEIQAKLLDPVLGGFIAINRSTFNLTNTVVDVIDRLDRLEAVVGGQGERIKMIDIAVDALNALVADLDRRLDLVEADVQEIKDRVSAIERFLKNEMESADENQLLEKFAPILRHDEWHGGPLMNPGRFAEGCELMPTGNTPEDFAAHIRGRRFTPAQLVEFLSQDFGEGDDAPSVSELTSTVEMIPHGIREEQIRERGRAEVENRAAIANGRAVFGAVVPLTHDPQKWSVKYFWFHSWNETAFPFGEGNHEGDWGCIDLTVHIPFGGDGTSFDIANATLVDAIVHEHGRPHRYSSDQLKLNDDGRVVVYLEKGTNEAHPQPGGAGGYDGVPILRDLFETEWPVIREHRGPGGDEGYVYDLKGSVRNLFDAALVQDVDVQLVCLYQGQWGEYDDDDFKNVGGRDITNAHGPLNQPKFRDRVSVIDHRDDRR